MSYKELLATRVLSVDAYWQELCVPSRRTSNEIPVPLWPGESLQQYEREFVRWLAARGLSLVDMRKDRVAERGLRLQFAHTRVARANDSQHRSTPPRPRDNIPIEVTHGSDHNLCIRTLLGLKLDENMGIGRISGTCNLVHSLLGRSHHVMLNVNMATILSA
ncbi:hypothetical protein PHMEG_00010870 [Phytophthora megakarya]|uniref:Uncharacterized protein n=1 Tax=Phytophthora megakarya TaxID=4795 RepID=A0A225WDK0_9STRA|nr:hypothetical protein PHMEG_00010870 [Phytophthora megakarya]